MEVLGSQFAGPSIQFSSPETGISGPTRRASSHRSGPSFRETLENLRTGVQRTLDISGMLNDLQSRVLSGRPLVPSDLLLYQIKASRFGLSVELIAKAVDSGLTTIRKLQAGQ